jgi:single-stranded DNA-binding protein
MAKIVRSPQLRYTQENQLAVTEMMVQFENVSPNSPPSTLKVVSWGNLATEVQENYNEGDEVILSGRLKMDTIERPEGFKEKKAEFIISSITPLTSSPVSSNSGSDNVVEMDSYKPPSKEEENIDGDSSVESGENGVDSSEEGDNLDNIPF